VGGRVVAMASFDGVTYFEDDTRVGCRDQVQCCTETVPISKAVPARVSALWVCINCACLPFLSTKTLRC
jgi:hypothetical protein